MACDALNEANRVQWVQATSPARERETWAWHTGRVTRLPLVRAD